MPASRTCTPPLAVGLPEQHGDIGGPVAGQIPEPGNADGPGGAQTGTWEHERVDPVLGHAVLEDDLRRAIVKRKQARQLRVAVAVTVLEGREVAILT